MAVVMLAVGSRGDVQPLLVLASALSRRGIEARVLATSDYTTLARQFGAELVPIDARIADLVAQTRTGSGRIAVATEGGQAHLLRRWVARSAHAIADAVLSTVREGDVVLTGILTRDAAVALAEARGCRPVTVIFTGQLPTTSRESHYFGHRFRTWSRYNAFWCQVNWSVASMLGSPASRRIRRRLGLDVPGRTEATTRADAYPILVAASPVVVPPARDWPASAHQTGALVESPPVGGRPFDAGLPHEVAAFLRAGPPPVYVGFGSMTDSAGHHALGRIVEAARLTGRRIVTPVVTGVTAGLVGPSVLAVDPLAHDLLFPAMAALIHHGGAGTTYAGLRAGVPSAAVPFGVDQTYHADRLHALGVGCDPVPVRRLTSRRLAAMIRTMTQGGAASGYADRAAQLGVVTRAEDGVQATVDLLSRLGHLD